MEASGRWRVSVGDGQGVPVPPGGADDRATRTASCLGNPCQVRGADRENPSERPVLRCPKCWPWPRRCQRYRAMILLTTFASLRFGEVTALERADIDVGIATVRVRRSFVEVQGRGLVAGPAEVAGRLAYGGAPSDGSRRCATPDRRMSVQLDGPRVHRSEGSADQSGQLPEADGVEGAGQRRSGRRPVPRPTPHREHPGGMSGVSTRDLMARMGHDSVRAAIIYQHATTEADARSRRRWRRAGGHEAQADEDELQATMTTARLARRSGAMRATLWPVCGTWPRSGARFEGRAGLLVAWSRNGWRRWDSNPRPPACKAGALAS